VDAECLGQDGGRAPGLDVNQQRAVTAPLRSANSSTPSTHGEPLTVGSGIARTRRISVIRLTPARRLAVPVEDHELSAGEFEGVHDGQPRGSGAVIIWDEGLAEVTRDEPGHLAFTLHGSKLTGGFALTRTGERRWILVKTRDATTRPGSDIVAERPASVRTGRTWEEVAHTGRPSTRVEEPPQRRRLVQLTGVHTTCRRSHCPPRKRRRPES
jgi:hypothetical protein